MKIKSILLLITLSLLINETKAQTVFPFHLVNGYILVEAKVNNIKGKFVFDTGTPLNFMLNNNLIPLDKDTFLTTGRQDLVRY
jgi:hypothetical protein